MSNEISARPSALPRSRNTRARQVGERLQQMARQLGAGAKLPAVPELRRDLGVSMTALGAALAELEARGIIERRNGVGTLVTERVTELVPRTLALVVSPRTLGAGHAPFWDFLVKTLEGHAHESGDKIEFHFALASAPQSAESGRACLQRGLVEGVEKRRDCRSVPHQHAARGRRVDRGAGSADGDLCRAGGRLASVTTGPNFCAVA